MNNQTMALAVGIEKPDPNDCVFGRGRRFQNHAGNRQLHCLVDERIVKFTSSRCAEKNNLIKEVFEIIGSTGRFLKRSEKMTFDEDKIAILWDEVSQEEAISKVSHTFRSRSRTNPPRKKKASVAASKLVRQHPSSAFSSNGGLVRTKIEALTRGVSGRDGAVNCPPMLNGTRVDAAPRLIEEELLRRKSALDEEMRIRFCARQKLASEMAEARQNHELMMRRLPPLQLPTLQPPASSRPSTLDGFLPAGFFNTGGPW